MCKKIFARSIYESIYYFTMLELLIVIAVIFVLASLLLPSLSKAKMQVGRTACLNVEKQIGTAFMFYLQDNNDYFPPYRDYGSPEKFWYGGSDTYGLLAQYLGMNDGWHYSPTYLLGIGVSLNVSGNIIYRNKLNCPSRKNFPGEINFDYAYSYSVYSSSRKMTRFTAPSKSCVLSESISYSAFSASTAASYMEFRHLNGANVLYADFHVSWMKFADIPVSYSDPFWKVE